MSRTQRCGNCDGCLAKACRQCTYCLDNPQNGGPGVKKQSCIARRCIRVMEGRLQRESANCRAKLGCGVCDECRQPDCGVCLICLDKRVLGHRFLPEALCAKKRCSDARVIDNISPAPPIGHNDNHGSAKMVGKTFASFCLDAKTPHATVLYNNGLPYHNGAAGFAYPNNNNNNPINTNANLVLRKRLLSPMDDYKKSRRTNNGHADSPPPILNYRSQLITTNGRPEDYGPQHRSSGPPDLMIGQMATPCDESLPTPPPSLNLMSQSLTAVTSADYNGHVTSQNQIIMKSCLPPNPNWSPVDQSHHRVTKNGLQLLQQPAENVNLTKTEQFSLLRDRLLASVNQKSNNNSIGYTNGGLYSNGLQQSIGDIAEKSYSNHNPTGYCNPASTTSSSTTLFQHGDQSLSIHNNNVNVNSNGFQQQQQPSYFYPHQNGLHSSTMDHFPTTVYYCNGNTVAHNVPLGAGSIITEPMGPMGQHEVVLQQL